MKLLNKTLSMWTIWIITISPIAIANTENNSLYSKWKNGPSNNDTFFPIAVWLQNPHRASQYMNAGINTYVGLWKGPTEEQISDLRKADMKLICHQNSVGLNHINGTTIIGWMHGDEPDNAQSLGKEKGYGPPIDPKIIEKGYENIKKNDPTRPVFLNLGQGVAWDSWHGRGVRTNHPEDYPEYLKGCDIASFDIYPAVHAKPEITGNLWYVAKGVERLIKWTNGKKIVWNCIECTQINHPTRKPTPAQVRSEVWMSLIHGSTGIIYFVHEWKPKFNEAALLSDPEMLREVTEINKQIKTLAPILNSPTIQNQAIGSTENKDVPIAMMMKEYNKEKYLFAVAMRGGWCSATFTIKGLNGKKEVEVLGENRALYSIDGIFKDNFEPYDVHIYKIK